MCGRFSLTEVDLALLARSWAAEVEAAGAASWRPRYNVAPGDRHLVLTASGGQRRLLPATFGLAGPRAASPLLVNARIETASSRPTFREAWQRRRAAVPADGFFEWTGPSSARRPTWFHLRSGMPMLLAALLGRGPGGELGFVVLTTEARAPVRALHHRMPVLIAPSLLDAWLTGEPPALAATAGEELLARPVSDRVNSTANDDPACLGPRAQAEQVELFAELASRR